MKSERKEERRFVRDLFPKKIRHLGVEFGISDFLTFDFLPEIKSIDGSFAATDVLEKHIQIFSYFCGNEKDFAHMASDSTCDGRLRQTGMRLFDPNQ